MTGKCGRRVFVRFGWGLAVGVLAPLLLGTPRVSASAFEDYALGEVFELPVGTHLMDALPDGRLIALAGDVVMVESGVGARQFQTIGALPSADIPSFGAAFLEVSPDGARVAVGNNGGESFSNYLVGVFLVSDLSGTWFTANHFLAAWVDDRHLALTGGEFGQPAFVSILDSQSPDPGNPVNPVVIDNIGGASAGVAFDTMGRLYTGNGFAIAGPSGTGALKAFDAAAWQNALTSGVPLDFENDGTLIIDILSADSPGFDAEGNLFIGGGDGDAHSDFAALVSAAAVGDALAGQGPVDPDDATLVHRFDPDDANPFDFYLCLYNAGAAELYIRDFGATTVYVYPAAGVAVPTVSAWGFLCLTLGILVFATVSIRRQPSLYLARPPRFWRVGRQAAGGRGHAR